jgi:DNA ligase 1
MLAFSQTCEAIRATTKKLEKTRFVADYLKSQPATEAAVAAIYFSGRPFPAYRDMPLQVGGSLLWRAIAELSGKSESELTEIYRRHGDAGEVTAEALPPRPQASLTLAAVQDRFGQIAAARGSIAKAHLLRDLLARATPLEAKYIVKIISGDLRIGLKESLVEEGIAKAFEVPLDEVKRANMLLGDIGETLQLAASGRLAEAHMRLFHPLDFMLASPVESPEQALSYFENVAVEDKYDGIRAHAHVGDGEIRLFSRTRDDITHSFPELAPALAALQQDAILDGEIVAWEVAPATRRPPANEVPDDGELRGDDPVSHEARQISTETASGQQRVDGRALPFSTLQQRLGRKKVSDKMLQECPVAYLIFDVLYAGGELLLDRPLRERVAILDSLLTHAGTAAAAVQVEQSSTELCGAGTSARESEATKLEWPVRKSDSAQPSQSAFSFAACKVPPATILRSRLSTAHAAEDIEALFLAARARGNEGLMIKDLDSPYTPGRRGKSWLKMKRELATLDVVVTAVEYGHGKRIGVLSDYTFGVWDGDRLVNIGKAYSGLTDVEIAEMTQWFLAHVTRDQGLRLEVEPKVVLEVAFNNMMRSDRHESGFALRFPRIVRLRNDKLPKDADTIETVKEIYEKQKP